MTITAAQAISALQARTDRSGACAEYAHEVAMKFGSKTPTVAGPTAWNVAEASDIQELPVAQAPANSFIWFKQKPGHAIMGYAPPEPGHVMFDPNGGGLDAISITDFAYGPLVAGSKHLRQGSVYTYLDQNPGVIYVGFSADYAGSVVAPAGPTPTQRQIINGVAHERSQPNTNAGTLISPDPEPNGLVDFAGHVDAASPHNPAATISVIGGSGIWFYSKGGGYFHSSTVTDHGVHDLPDLTEHLFPVPAVVTPPATTPAQPSTPDPVTTPPAPTEPSSPPADATPITPTVPTTATPGETSPAAGKPTTTPWWVSLFQGIWAALFPPKK